MRFTVDFIMAGPVHVEATADFAARPGWSVCVRTFHGLLVVTGCAGKVEVEGVAAAVAGLCHVCGVLEELAVVEKGLQRGQTHQRHT